MKKKKLKLNILDIAIVVALICVIAVIVFRSEINELLSDPEVAPVTLTISERNVDLEIARGFKSGDEALLVFEDGGEQTVATIAGVRFSSPAGEDPTVRLELTLTLDGYRRIGAYYTAAGEKLSYGGTVTVLLEDGSQSFSVVSAEYLDTTVTQ